MNTTLDTSSESLSSFLNGTLSNTYDAMSGFLSSSWDKLVHSSSLTAVSVRTVDSALSKVSWSDVSSKFMLVPEGLEHDLTGFSKLVIETGPKLIKEYKGLLVELNDNIDRALQERQLNIHGFQAHVSKVDKTQQSFLKEVSKHIRHSNHSHVKIDTQFFQAAMAVSWYRTSQAAFSIDMSTEVKYVSEQLTDVAKKLTGYMEFVQLNQTRDAITTAQALSKLALEIADKAEIVSSVGLLHMQLKMCIIKFGTQVTSR